MKELDVLFERYLEQHYDAAPDAEKAVLKALLQCEDPDIFAWCMHREPPPRQFAALIDKLRAHA